MKGKTFVVTRKVFHGRNSALSYLFFGPQIHDAMTCIGTSKNHASSHGFPLAMAAARMRSSSSRFGSNSPASQRETVGCLTPAISANADCERPKMFCRIWAIGSMSA